MADYHLNNSKSLQGAQPEAFARFLEFLSHDAKEAGHRYTRLHRKLSGFFSMKGIADPASAADETIDRAVLKISAGTDVPDVDKYCLGIARNIVKEKLRFVRREEIAFQEFIEDLNDSSDEEIERIYTILKPCLGELAAKDQQLLMDYCHEIKGRGRAEYRRQLAERMKTTVLALRLKVTRLRNSLSDCVRKRMNEA